MRNTKPGDNGTSNAHNHLFILFYHLWGLARIKIHWNFIWLKAWSHMTSLYTWGLVSTLHDFGGVLGWPLNTFLWALTIPWSWLLAHVWSGPQDNRRREATGYDFLTFYLFDTKKEKKTMHRIRKKVILSTTMPSDLKWQRSQAWLDPFWTESPMICPWLDERAGIIVYKLTSHSSNIKLGPL